MSDDLPYWLALCRFRAFGAVRLGKLSRGFATMREAFEAGASRLVEAGIDPKLANKFLQERAHIDPEHELALIEQNGLQAITLKDDAYPNLLKQIYDPPAVLFVKGRLCPDDLRHLAIVGSRKATLYGKRVTRRLVEPLAGAGVVIVSGLAYGIDACAHQATIESGGTTLAVLASGLDEDMIYPSQHRALASAIVAKGGALISELPVGTPPLKQNFPFRNRIIAGLCHATLIVEATAQSGTLITARSAMDSNRDVFAVPGPIDAPLSEGPNRLIRDGARVVLEPTDIFDIRLSQNAPIDYEPKNEEETVLINALSQQPKHIDEIVVESTLPIHVAASTLTMLEMKGVARHEGGRYYTKT